MLRPGLTRFILALLVVISHFSNGIMLGKFAVCCFFILSGYWISSMYEHRYSKKENELSVFYISRLWRLFPMYYLFTILGLFSTMLFYPIFFIPIAHLDFLPKVSAIVSNLFILGSTDPQYRIIGPAWSLEIEIQFYFIFPLFAYIISRSKKKSAPVFLIACVLISLSAYLYFKDRIEFNLLPYICLFLFGVLVYENKISFSRGVERVSMVLFLIILGSQYFVPSLHTHFMEEKSYYYFFSTLILVIVAIPMLVNSVYVPTNPQDKMFGEMSYIVYLSHWVWIQPYYAYVWRSSVPTSAAMKAVYAAGVIVFTLASSYAAYKYIDRPFEKRRHKWVSLQKEKPMPLTQ